MESSVDALYGGAIKGPGRGPIHAGPDGVVVKKQSRLMRCPLWKDNTKNVPLFRTRQLTHPEYGPITFSTVYSIQGREFAAPTPSDGGTVLYFGSSEHLCLAFACVFPLILCCRYGAGGQLYGGV